MNSLNNPLVVGNVWLFFVLAVFLGVLCGLQPGRSKTSMIAFITSVKATVKQAFLLGVCIAISQTVIIWLLAVGGFYFLSAMNIEQRGAYFQIFTGVSVMALSCWMLWQTRQSQLQLIRPHGNGPHQGIMFRTDNYWVEICIAKDDLLPRFRIYFYTLDRAATTPLSPGKIILKIFRPDTTFQEFEFIRREKYLEAIEELPEPHEFEVVLQFRHSDHGYVYKVRFVEFFEEELALENDDFPSGLHGLGHVAKIKKQWVGQKVSMGQIILFGLAGGLMSSPEAFSILMLCFQFKNEGLGLAMIAVFTLGLAAALVTAGAMLAVNDKEARQNFRIFFDITSKLSYVSSLILVLVGLFVAIDGLRNIV